MDVPESLPKGELLMSGCKMTLVKVLVVKTCRWREGGRERGKGLIYDFFGIRTLLAMDTSQLVVMPFGERGEGGVVCKYVQYYILTEDCVGCTPKKVVGSRPCCMYHTCGPCS